MQGLEHDIIHIIYHFKYWGLFLVLSLGMVGIPVPDEFILTFSGFQTIIGRMALGHTLIVASLGSFVGMNFSYWIGRGLGYPFLHRFGKYMHLNEKRIERAEHWFQRFGNILIILGYFFPGFRHFTAYFAGISKIDYRKYVSLVAIGAFLWTGTFIILGRFVGSHWREFTTLIHRFLLHGGIFIALAALLFYLISLRRKRAES